MLVLTLTRQALLCLLTILHFTVSQTTTVSVLGAFAVQNPVSVVTANPTATTYYGTTTGSCRPGPCTPLVFATDIVVFGPSTAAVTGYYGPHGAASETSSATFACVFTSSLMTGTCVDYVTWYSSGIITSVSTGWPMVPPHFAWVWEPLIVTAGLDKLNSTLATTSSTTSTSSTSASASPTTTPSTSALSTSTPSTSVPPTSAPSTSAPSISTPPASAPSTGAPSTSASSASAPSTNASSASAPSANNTVSNSGTTPTVGLGSTAATGAATRHKKGYLGGAIAGFAGVMIVLL